MKRSVVWSAAALFAAWALPASAQYSGDVIKVGVATDMSSLYSDINGPGAVIAAQMAIDDIGGSIAGKKIELLNGDIQNKADVAATLAGRWYDSEGGHGTLKSTKWDDPVFGASYVRADGRKMHDMYLFEVKPPTESKGPWDYYKLLATIPGEQAFRPLDQGNCPLVAKQN